jgi:hypothetical protein
MAEISSNTITRLQNEGVMPDVSFLAALSIDPVNVTVVNTSGDVFQQTAGQWQEIPSPWGSFPRGDSSKPRILAITPFHPNYGVKDATWESIRAAIMAYSGPIDWIISSNDNPADTPYENVTRQHNKARAMALAGEYDALLSIEADMIVPADTIDRLLATGADIAYGLYVWRHQKKRWSAYTELTLWGGTSVSLDYTGQDAREAHGRVIDVAGLGMGCTLIKRNVLQTTPFRLYEGTPGDWLIDHYGKEMARVNVNPYRPRRGMLCDDYLLALDAQHYGFTQRCDLGLICGHINGSVALWPDPAVKDLVRIEEI